MKSTDDAATSWRDLADQLTPEQITRFEALERTLKKTYGGVDDEMLNEARWEAQQNLIDTVRFGHIAVPAGAQAAGHWEQAETGSWTRLLAVSNRSLDREGGDTSVCVNGEQSADGTATWGLFVLADDRKPLTSGQAREYAAMVLAAADELDALGGVR